MTKHEAKRRIDPGSRSQDKLLELTTTEVFFLESTLCAIPTPQERAEGLLSLRPFLLRLGSLFLEGRGGTITVNEEETWHLRDKVPLTAKMGSEAVGTNLHRKLYNILLEYDNERRVLVESGAMEGPGREEAMRLMKEAEDARESGNPDPKSDNHPGGDAGPGPAAQS